MSEHSHPESTNIEHLNSTNIVAFIADIFDRRGHEEYLGEAVTMQQHMLQGATLAVNEGGSEELVVAALLHDIGHFTSEFGSFTMDDTVDRYHESAGAEILERFFPKLVVDCVRHHVAAKRYLCAVDASYHDALSVASQHSLKLQGGAMSRQEIEEFEKLEHLDDIVKVRLFDDAGKDPEMETPNFAYFAPMIKRVLTRDSLLG